MNSSINEQVAFVLHSQWKAEREQDDYHMPTRCPNYESAAEDSGSDPNAGMVHCNRCDTGMVDYAALEEYQKKSWRTKAEALCRLLDNSGVSIALKE